MTIAEISIHTLTPETNLQQCDLLVTVSPDFFAYTVMDEQGQLRLFEKYTPPENGNGLEYMAGIQGDWLSKNYRQVKVAYCAPDAVAVPSKFYQPANAAAHLNAVYGDAGGEILLNDFIGHRSLYCVYRVQKDLVRAVVRHFPLASVWHAQSLLLSQKDQHNTGACLQVNFLQDACCFLLQKNGQLLSVKTYPFSHVPDMAYTLLAFCGLHGVKPDETQLLISGWINERSPIHEELRKYFLHTQFASGRAAAQGFEQFPAHFFELFYLLKSV